jgi:DNA-directed RNA polymerase specialized sigma24 family protein
MAPPLYVSRREREQRGIDVQMKSGRDMGEQLTLSAPLNRRFSSVSVLESIMPSKREIVLDALPDNLKDVLTGRECQGLSYAQLSAQLGISEAKVRSRLGLARKRAQSLHEVLAERGEVRKGMTIKSSMQKVTTPDVLSLAGAEVSEGILLRLTPRQRQALLLREAQGLSNKAAGQEMGVAPGTFVVHLRQGREKFKKLLDEAWYGVGKRIEDNTTSMIRVALGVTGNLQDAEDVVQEVHLKTALKLVSGSVASTKTASYDNIAARWKGLDKVRQRHTAVSLDAPFAVGLELTRVGLLPDSSEGSQPELYMLSSELKKEVLEGIRSIENSSFRQILIDRLILGKEYADILAESGEPYANIKRRFSRARFSLQRQLCAMNPQFRDFMRQA